MINIVKQLVEESKIHFGTSGIRGKVSDLTDFVSYAFTLGFLEYLKSSGGLTRGKEEIKKIAVAGDLRLSTKRILSAVTRAIRDQGLLTVYCGNIPIPALIYYGMENDFPSIMITGSHIPEDRNGIKFNLKSGEILKRDEKMIREQKIVVDESIFDEKGYFLKEEKTFFETEGKAGLFFTDRYVDFFPKNFLAGKKVIVYQHSAVGRDMLPELLKKFGAEVKTAGRSDAFVPIDTEAISLETAELVKNFVKEWPCDAMVSTDGDSDRPFIADETGKIVRGDILGIITAKFLNADSVSTVVSANTAVEKSGFFQSVKRTKVGSPFVIESLNEEATKWKKVVGYESNGGFLIKSDIEMNGKILKSLPTRDSFVVILSVLGAAVSKNCKISQVADELPKRFTFSENIKGFEFGKGEILIKNLFNTGDDEKNRKNSSEIFGELCGNAVKIDLFDGARITFGNGEIIHLRPSGNAPEFRVYCESDSEERSAFLCSGALEKATKLLEILNKQ